MDFPIQHKQNDKRGIFYMKKDGNTVAELTYTLENQIMTIDHTEVNPSMEAMV